MNHAALLEGGAIVPFIARYRKAATGALDDEAIQRIADHANVVAARESRRAAILDSLTDQGVLTPELAKAIAAATTLDHVGRRERAEQAPSHRVLAAERGEAESLLKGGFELPRDAVLQRARAAVVSARAAPVLAREVGLAIDDAIDRLLRPSLEAEYRRALKQRPWRARPMRSLPAVQCAARPPATVICPSAVTESA